MAILNIKNATVERKFYGDKGAAVVEKFTKQDGSEGKSYYSLWFDEPQNFEIGATGSFSGLFSVKVEEYEPKSGGTAHSAKVSVNSARVDGELTYDAASTGEEEPF